MKMKKLLALLLAAVMLLGLLPVTAGAEGTEGQDKRTVPVSYRLEIVEQKTGKSRVFTVPLVIQQHIEYYCLRNGIQRNDLIFPITEMAVQKQLAIVCEYLGCSGISTHSFRKWYATEIYKNSGFDIALVQRLLQHSSAAVMQRYIGIEPQRIEKAIEGHARLI